MVGESETLSSLSYYYSEYRITTNRLPPHHFYFLLFVGLYKYILYIHRIALAIAHTRILASPQAHN